MKNKIPRPEAVEMAAAIHEALKSIVEFRGWVPKDPPSDEDNEMLNEIVEYALAWAIEDQFAAKEALNPPAQMPPDLKDRGKIV
jgi:hypothetical protein